ncbi:uncharacterized protein PRCAT00001542001 [Priceomyces carsonii]|uniref:uncharacterized protein n=1 Tax=Priceomyces carsonii TaxID=28549 RepID=UPI002EDA6279|nr:unnamed protein product [Priceomyces carsonii]
MTRANRTSIDLVRHFKTKSGTPITVGTGTGTKWQWKKKLRPEEERGTLDEELVEQLLLALKNGYNHIDTAEVYTTHPEVAAAIKRSGRKREDLWVTTKYGPGFKERLAESKGPEDFIDRSLKDLDNDYIDLVLIHFPFFNTELSHGQNIGSAWKELIKAKKDGKVRYIGVSNFAIPHLEETFKVSDSPEYYPVVNQIEFNPYLQNQSKDIVQYCRDHKILVEAYGPLTPLFRVKKDGVERNEHPLENLLPELAEKYHKTDSQILLAYTLQKGILPITTSSKEERIRQALEASTFSLDDSDVKEIDDVGSTFHFRSFFNNLFDDYE